MNPQGRPWNARAKQCERSKNTAQATDWSSKTIGVSMQKIF